MNTSMLWPMTRVYSRFSGCDEVGCSAKVKQHLCQQLSNGEALVTSAWGRLGTMERISVGLPQLDTSPSATSTASLNSMASTSSHFQGTGYGTSSSSVRILFILGPLFCESMSDGLCSSVVHSLPDSPFSLVSPSLQPTFLSSHHMPVPVSHPILDFHCDFSHFRCLNPVSFILYPVDLYNLPYPS